MIHHRCRDTLADALRKRLGTPLEWFIADPELSEFPFRGDLLRGVEEIQTEYHIATPFGKDYILDVALLGPEVGKKRIIMGGIELELHHKNWGSGFISFQFLILFRASSSGYRRLES